MKKGYITGKGYIVHTAPYVTVVGGVNMDIGGWPSEVPVDRDSNPGAVRMSLGGVGRNIAHNMSLLGLDVRMVTAFGDDLYAQKIAASCGELGIDISQSPVIPEVTDSPIENTQESAQENAETETASQQEAQTETAATGKVEIATEDFEGSSDPENAERKYTYTYQMPTITIEGNEEAQDKIQKDLNAYVETFLDSINNSDFGTVYEGEMSGMTSYEELSFQVIRADDKVISVVWGNEGYNQGAHGWYIQDYRNYYTQTGEKITFDSLGNGFRDKALELVTKKAAEMQATDDCFFPDYEKSIKLVVLDGTENMDTIYQEIYGADIAGTGNGPASPTFSITGDGFVFESGQYVLQPYAVGIIDFEIPASDFGDALAADIFKQNIR